MPPRHHDIADDLRHQITTGRVNPGDVCRLKPPWPTGTRSAQRRCGVPSPHSRGRSRREDSGKGNFVRRPLRKITYVGGWGTLDPWTAADTALRVTIRTSTVLARGHLAALLRTPSDTPLTEFLCVSHEGESPHSLARLYIPCDLAPATAPDEQTSRGEASNGFAVLSPEAIDIRETVCTRLPTLEEATTLRISTAVAVLAITRIAADTAGRVLEAGFLVFPGDRADAVFTTRHVIDERRTQA